MFLKGNWKNTVDSCSGKSHWRSREWIHWEETTWHCLDHSAGGLLIQEAWLGKKSAVLRLKKKHRQRVSVYRCIDRESALDWRRKFCSINSLQKNFVLAAFSNSGLDFQRHSTHESKVEISANRQQVIRWTALGEFLCFHNCPPKKTYMYIDWLAIFFYPECEEDAEITRSRILQKEGFRGSGDFF